MKKLQHYRYRLPTDYNEITKEWLELIRTVDETFDMDEAFYFLNHYAFSAALFQCLSQYEMDSMLDGLYDDLNHSLHECLENAYRYDDQDWMKLESDLWSCILRGSDVIYESLELRTMSAFDPLKYYNAEVVKFNQRTNVLTIEVDTEEESELFVTED